MYVTTTPPAALPDRWWMVCSRAHTPCSPPRSPAARPELEYFFDMCVWHGQRACTGGFSTPSPFGTLVPQ